MSKPNVVLAALVFLMTAPAQAFDDFQTWHTATWNYLQHEQWFFAAGAELRLDDDSTTGWFARVSQQTSYRPGERWAFDANLSYILLRAQGAFDLDTLRLELAGTPTWKIGDRTHFDLRTRLDYWVREGEVDDDLIARLRPRLRVRLGDETGRSKLFFGTELLFSESQGRFFQNRLYPIGASLPVGRRARVELYAMVFSIKIADEWRHDLVLGQSWLF